MKNEFLTELLVADLGDGWRILTGELKYVDERGVLWTVPVGFKTDFASVPSLARWFCFPLALCQLIARLWLPEFYLLELFCLWVIFVAEWLEDSTTDSIAAVHDFLYKTKPVSRWQADAILFQGMFATGAPHNPMWKRCLFWFNVRCFGWVPWRTDR